jgi:hypothetical protein
MLSFEAIEGASISGLVFSIIGESLDSNDASSVSFRHFHLLSPFLLDHFLISALAALSMLAAAIPLPLFLLMLTKTDAR